MIVLVEISSIVDEQISVSKPLIMDPIVEQSTLSSDEGQLLSIVHWAQEVCGLAVSNWWLVDGTVYSHTNDATFYIAHVCQ